MILFADSEGTDQTARRRRLIWAFAVRIFFFFFLHDVTQFVFDVFQISLFIFTV